jgi:proteasome beta subunit
VEGFSNGTGPDQAAFMNARIPSFTHFLSSYDPSLLPLAKLGSLAGSATAADVIKSVPHATTIVAVACEGGVVMAGDRRATAGNMISKRDVEKVFRADEYSAIAFAGALAFALELVRLFGVELEHYEKMEGRSLTLEGKAHRLSKMTRDNLAAAMQGLAVIPLFVGYDEETRVGRIFSYDVAGGPYEEHRFHSIGSGSVFAKSALKKYYHDGMSASDAALACVQAL